MSKEFIYDDDGNLIRGYIVRNPEHAIGPEGRCDECDPCTCEYPYEVEGVGHHPSCGLEPGEIIHADIREAADWLNDVTKDMRPDTFAAVLQAAIARRD